MLFIRREEKTVMKRTGEVSRLVGISRRTLQYYDDEKIFTIRRSEKNHRLYDEEALNKIWKIMVYKEIGFELKEIKQILSVSNDKQKEFLRLRMKKIRDVVRKLQYQEDFISWILLYGMPQKPVENDNMTYLESLKALRKNKIDKYEIEYLIK